MSRMFSSSVEVLADTNVWVAYFRGKPAKAQEQPVAEVLDRLIGEDRVVLCGVVEMELCQGLRENERGTLEAHLSALDFLEAEREDFRRAGSVLGGLRRRSITVPSSDALVAVLCLRHELTLLEFDKYFEHIENLKRVPWRRP